MSKHLKSIKCGDKTYNISHDGETLYYSSSSKTGGTTLKGAEFKNNQIKSTSDGKELSDFGICELIKAKNKSSGGCFLTTIVCQSLNKADDCVELETLRQFRDEIMLEHNEWRVLVDEYYKIAPNIANNLENNASITELSNLYNTYILDCMDSIEKQNYSQAVARYTQFVDYCRDYYGDKE